MKKAIGLLCSVMASVFVLRSQVTFVSSNLPIVKIFTNNVEIPDEPKIDAIMGIIWNGDGQVNQVSDSCTEFYGEIGIERRGSSSNGFPQRSYSIETRGPDSSVNYNVSIFDWPAENDWVLYAPYTDKVLIRNVLTYKFGREMGHWAPRTKLCEVVLNGEYQGVYVLMERIKQSPGRVDVDPLEPDDTMNNELSGGYILKIDKTTAGGVIAWNSPYTSQSPGNAAIGYQMHDPDISEMSAQQLNYIEDYVTEWETVLKSPMFADPVTGYSAYIDVNSFIDYMLVNEISKNVDGYRLSAYLHKQRLSEGGKLFAGPLWDFNLAFGNANYCQGGQTAGWELNFNNYCGGTWQNPFWYKRLLEDNNYARSVNCRYQELRQTIWQDSVILPYIDSVAAELSQAADRHFSRWPILGTYVWPNNFIGTTFQEEVNYLKEWITDRLIWMDANMFGSCPDLGIMSSSVQNISLFPNPVNESFQVTSHSAVKSIVLTDMSGKLVKKWSYNEQSVYSVSEFQPGMYWVTILLENESATSKLLCIE